MRLDHLLSKEQLAAGCHGLWRSGPATGERSVGGAQGWNIDYLTSLVELARKYNLVTVREGSEGVEREEGSGGCLTRCWVLKDRTTQCWACS